MVNVLASRDDRFIYWLEGYIDGGGTDITVVYERLLEHKESKQNEKPYRSITPNAQLNFPGF